MRVRSFGARWKWLAAIASTVMANALCLAEAEPQIGIAPVPLGSGPYQFDTAEQHEIRVDVVARGLAHPFSLAFLPNGDALVVERGLALRLVRAATSMHPELVAEPIAGAPNFIGHAAVTPDDVVGIQDIALHPDFPQNRRLYFTYNQPGCRTPEGEDRCFRFMLARATLKDGRLVGAENLVEGEPIGDIGGSRMVFDKDNMLYVTIGAAAHENTMKLAQQLGNIYGKVLRVSDDGGIPVDNPFVSTPGARGEIYSLGHRDQSGIAIDEAASAVVSSEYGPQGGDKINRILPGRNYGWPKASYGRDYDGAPLWPLPTGPDIEPAIVVWNPSISPSGIAFYTADRFPAWRGNLFVAGARRSQIDHTGALERIVFNDQLQEIRRESLLGELHQRLRDVRQGPDGLLYVLTDEDDGALLRLSPAEPSQSTSAREPFEERLMKTASITEPEELSR